MSLKITERLEDGAWVRTTFKELHIGDIFRDQAEPEKAWLCRSEPAIRNLNEVGMSVPEDASDEALEKAGLVWSVTADRCYYANTESQPCS